MSREPSMFDIDYKEAAAVCLDQGIRLSLPGQCIQDSKVAWQFTTGFDDYRAGRPLRQGWMTCVKPESRRLYRLGWLASMFLDLQNREQIVMAREFCAGGE